jgi:hypothetical protein
VDEDVVVAAEGQQVLDPGVEVVSVRPRRRRRAARPTTAAITGVQGAADPPRDEPVGTADIQW